MTQVPAKKVSVIYHAPKDDSKVLEWNGFTFFDGVKVEIENSDANKAFIKRLATNKYFETHGADDGDAKPQAQQPKDHASQPQSTASESAEQPEGEEAEGEQPGFLRRTLHTPKPKQHR